MGLPRKPDWLRVRVPSGATHANLRRVLRYYGLHTVCEEAHCPNVAECWGGGTATFMIMGDVCTRACRFCAVTSGRPGRFLDPFEPHRLSRAVKEMQLDYAVITSVCRDDLPDGGAAHFAETIRAVREARPDTRIEVLIPDFRGRVGDIRTVVEARPDVIAHNLETARRLTPLVRDPRAKYSESLSVLRKIKRLDDKILTKSSLMLGVGEQDDEVVETMRDLRGESVDILT
ncbi:MAG: lipoyl synthase, partial [Candidatus Geothermarchaeales archaeon]